MSRKKSWLARFSRAARWMLPREEAAEVIADYTDLLAGDARSEEELERDLGDPVQAVKLLVRPGQWRLGQTFFSGLTASRSWLIVFCALTACLLSAAFSGTPLSPTYMLLKWYEWSCNEYTTFPLYLLPVGHLLAGMAVSLVWFRRRGGREKRPLSKWFFLCFLLLLAGIAVAWFITWKVAAAPHQFLTTWVEGGPVPEDMGGGTSYRGYTSPLLATMGTWLWYICPLGGVIGMVGLWKARMEDRRWSAVYVLALTFAVLALAVMAMLYNFSGVRIGDPYTDLTDHWFQLYILRFVLVTVPGLVGTGVALC